MATTILLASAADDATIVDCLVDAFARDPFFRTLWPDDDRYCAAAEEWFAADVRQLHAHGSFWIAADGSAVTCWVPPDADVADLGEFGELQAIVDRTAGDRGAGAMAVLEAADATAAGATRAGTTRAGPTSAEERPWTCVYVAVRDAAQGRGLGRRLALPHLARADRDELAVCLASTNPRNLTFYERLGFRTVTVVQPSPVLPPVWSLRREPRARREPAP